MDSETKNIFMALDDYIEKTKIFLMQIKQSSEEISMSAEIAEKRCEIIASSIANLGARGFSVIVSADENIINVESPDVQQ